MTPDPKKQSIIKAPSRAVAKARSNMASRAIAFVHTKKIGLVSGTIDAEAQRQLALKYLEGDGVAVDIEAAIRLLRSAAELGHAPAQCDLGELYHDGVLVPENYSEATKWYRLAVEQNYAKAMVLLSSLTGETEDNDLPVTVELLTKAANLGYAPAQYRLGVLTELGVHRSYDFEAAAILFRLAADQGHSGAQYHLGMLFFTLSDVETNMSDDVEAVVLFRKAAANRHAYAAFRLSQAYAHGLGVEQDAELASKWQNRFEELK